MHLKRSVGLKVGENLPFVDDEDDNNDDGQENRRSHMHARTHVSTHYKIIGFIDAGSVISVTVITF